MERIELKITQETDEGIIKVSAERNGVPVFFEEFKCNNLQCQPIHTISADEIENSFEYYSVSSQLLFDFTEQIAKSRKTNAKALYGHSQSKFELTSLIDIRNFEKVSGVRFDYSKFSNLMEFQRYFKTLLK